MLEFVEQLLSLIADRNDRALEASIFGFADPLNVAEAIWDFMESELGSVRDVVFYRAGVGLVIGLSCKNAGDVVLKIHRRDSASLSALSAAQRIQGELALAGFPAPQPALVPTPIAQGIATAEELVRSDRVDGRSPSIRAELAKRLHQFIHTARALAPESIAELPSPTNRTRLWGEPHDLRFDFGKTSGGAEWIDRIAAHAQRAMSDTSSPDVIAHLDWRVENVAFREGQLCGVYDWDSLGRVPEAIAVGQASAHFSTDWTVGHSTLPTVPDMAAFLADYESARGSPFAASERSAIDAANLMAIAYAARCEHSDAVLRPDLVPIEPPSWRSLLTSRSAQPLSLMSGLDFP